MIEKLYRIAEGLNSRFQDGDDPFYIATRLAEECGEVASQVSHFEHKGVKAEKLGPPDRDAFAKELQDVMRAVLQLAIHYDLQPELTKSVDDHYRQIVREGWVEPLPEESGNGEL
ncbi:MAG: hypothetical protein OXF62_10045 [Caldilineaceae bacterium]|nr:hypothetical protein [Caldilineaceae bacterium]MCY4118585.1 hypothetical protein [Caldilineaceae bacterium]